MTALDPRLPLVLDTRDVARRPGTMIERSWSLPAPSDFGTEVIAVRQGSPLELDLRLESVTEGILVTGTATASATGVCVRCLDSVSEPVKARFQELFAYADRAQHLAEVGADDSQDDGRLVVDGLIDLEPVLLDAVVPALPYQPVCREDCPGLCAQCGARLQDDPDHRHDVIDPRWSALAHLASGPDAENEEKRN